MSFVRPLANALQAAGLRVWYDEFALSVGDSLNRSVDRGLANSRYGIVVFSPAFFRKEWTRRELDGLVARQTAEARKIILPVWHEVSADEIRSYSPPLADLIAVPSRRGIEEVVSALMRAMGIGRIPQLDVIMIPGLAGAGENPRIPLEPIVRLLSATVDSVTIGYLAWASGSYSDLSTSIRLLMEGTLSERVAVRLDARVADLGRQPESPVLLVAYSIGGYILYRWLAKYGPPTANLAVVAIAAPYAIRSGRLQLPLDPTRWVAHVSEPPVDPHLVVRRLGPGNLLIISAREDLVFDASWVEFPPTLADAGLVRQQNIPGAGHRSILTAPTVLDSIRKFVLYRFGTP